MFSGCPSVRVRVRACVRVEAFSDRFAVDISLLHISVFLCVLFTARCYASAVLATGLCLCLSVCLSVSVCHMSEFY